jgi:poly-gamma-glutamate capsule biosynthesis protein CapA/YwtB (metallophosphatase superfamily)
MKIGDPIKVLVTGDFCPTGRIEDLAINHNYTSIINDFSDVFEGNDLNITDLECPLTKSDSARKKTGPHQKADPETIGVLKFLNIGLVTLANNHIMDFGSEGFEETLNLCNANGIKTTGIQNNGYKGAVPFTMELKDTKVSILNFADEEFISSPDYRNNANPINPVLNYNDIISAKKNCDKLILIIHGGNEFYNLPSPRTKILYRFYAEVGADIIVSHHTHRFSGYEIYKNKPIFYGLGNFLYDRAGEIDTGWNRGYVVRFKISETTNFEIIPLKQCVKSPGLFHLNDKERDRFENEINHLNHIIADDCLLEEEFNKFCQNSYSMYESFIEPNFGRIIAALRKRGLFPHLISKRKRLLLLNLIRCESHREVLMNILDKNE